MDIDNNNVPENEGEKQIENAEDEGKVSLIEYLSEEQIEILSDNNNNNNNNNNENVSKKEEKDVTNSYRPYKQNSFATMVKEGNKEEEKPEKIKRKDTQNIKKFEHGILQSLFGSFLRLFSVSGEEKQIPRLISIAFSHYNEKLRWALNKSGIMFTEDPHSPPLLNFFTLPASNYRASMSPMLVLRMDNNEEGKDQYNDKNKNKTLWDSTSCFDYLYTAYYDQFYWLYGKKEDQSNGNGDLTLKEEIMDLEEYLDQHLGVPTRRVIYTILIPQRKQLLKIGGSNVSWIESTIFNLIAGIFGSLIAKVFGIDFNKKQEIVLESREEIGEVFDTIEDIIKQKQKTLNKEVGSEDFDDVFLASSDQFSSLEVTLASLAYPLIFPQCMVDSNIILDVSEFNEDVSENITYWRDRLAGKYCVYLYNKYRFNDFFPSLSSLGQSNDDDDENKPKIKSLPTYDMESKNTFTKNNNNRIITIFNHGQNSFFRPLILFTTFSVALYTTYKYFESN